ncbi:FlgD immunoglobulin-like domain containing protein, partial [Candidatus Zixiibacteriota bacterium]
FRGDRTLHGTLNATPMAVGVVPESYILFQNYPNPFNASTEIRYRIPGDARVRLSIYDVRGELVRILVDAVQQEGEHNARWDGRDQTGQETSSGLYFCALEAEDFQEMMKMVLLR